MISHFQNLSKLEFVITNACTGKCKHCFSGEHPTSGEHIDPAVAIETIEQLAKKFELQTVMTFGGEPLLYPEVVYAILGIATKLHIPKRQVITNGFFQRTKRKYERSPKGFLRVVSMTFC